jgi:hypothetical protein
VQPLGGTSSAGTVYTSAQVAGFLAGGSLQERWLFDHLGPDFRTIDDLSQYLITNSVPELDHDTSRAVPRTLKLQADGRSRLNWLQDLIRVRYQIATPDGGTLTWTAATLALVPPKRSISPEATTIGGAGTEAYDLLGLLADDTFASDYAAPAGASYAQQAISLVGGYTGPVQLTAVIPDSGKTLPANAPLMWGVGDSRLKAVNDLLYAGGYIRAWSDENGVVRSTPLPDWSMVTPANIWDSTASAAPFQAPLQLSPDPSLIFNRFLVKVEDPRRTNFYVRYDNNDPASPISVQNYHPKGKKITDSSITDPATAQARAKYEAQLAARYYNPLQMDSVAWPFGQNLDVYQVAYSTADEGAVNAAFLEHRWVTRCAPGELTSHYLYRVYSS